MQQYQFIDLQDYVLVTNLTLNVHDNVRIVMVTKGSLFVVQSLFPIRPGYICLELP